MEVEYDVVDIYELMCQRFGALFVWLVHETNNCLMLCSFIIHKEARTGKEVRHTGPEPHCVNAHLVSNQALQHRLSSCGQNVTHSGMRTTDDL